jgi:NAD(P)-dependent dehydrogenase (short-subunit alcohol dehydrogenase family)
MIKKILVTGSTRGIGLSVAEKFHSNGWNVCLNGRNQDKLMEISERLNKERSNSALGVKADLSLNSDLNTLSEMIISQWGTLDCIIFNIGSGHGSKGFASTMEENLASLKTNFLDVVKSSNKLCKLLSQNQPSSIIFIGSIAQDSNVNAPFSYAYSKKALNNFARYQAIALSKQKVSVNVINPGHILTEGGVWARKKQESNVEFNNFVSENIPVQRIGTSEEVAEFTYMLVNGNSNKFITGSQINIDGGTSINIK